MGREHSRCAHATKEEQGMTGVIDDGRDDSSVHQKSLAENS